MKQKNLILMVVAVGCGSPRQWRALFASQREADVRPAHGQPPNDIAHSLGFAAIGLEKFQARRRRVEKIADFDRGSVTEGSWLWRRLLTSINRDAPRVWFVGVARGHRQRSRSTNRG